MSTQAIPEIAAPKAHTQFVFIVSEVGNKKHRCRCRSAKMPVKERADCIFLSY